MEGIIVLSYYNAMIEEGQFQCHIGVFQKIEKPPTRRERMRAAARERRRGCES